jgi:hypothetical protein
MNFADGASRARAGEGPADHTEQPILARPPQAPAIALSASVGRALTAYAMKCDMEKALSGRMR